MSEQNKAASRRLAEEALAGGNYDLVDELVDPSYVAYDPASPEPIRGTEGLKQLIRGYKSAFPDMDFRIEDEIAEGDKVVTRWIARGTHQGELFGIAPTGKQATVNGITIDRFSGGKIVESWNNWDALGLMQQLGAIPQMAQA
jgi:steroid delta-isomerase-like uncharacterized protein